MKPSGLLYSVRGGVAPKLIDYIYPLGTVLTFTKDVDPNDIYTHQTWERFAKGKTLVGVDEDDTDFASVGNTGGEKTHALIKSEMPSHWHFVTDNGNTGAVYSSSKSLNSSSSTSAPNYATRLTKTGSGYTKAGDDDTFRLITASAGSGTAHNNLQPYETVYYWKRTA